MASRETGALRPARVTRAEALARTLESEIVAASLAAGERIGTRAQLRDRYGVAAATINETVRLMEMRGLVEARPGPGGGVFATGASARAAANRMILGLDWERATLADCVEVRTTLEPLVCTRAAREYTLDDIADLLAIVAEMDESVGDPRRYFRANWAFHRRVAVIGSNSPLRSMYLMLSDFLESGLADLEYPDITPERGEVHRRLVAAIVDGEPAALDRALRDHAALSPLTSDTPP